MKELDQAALKLDQFTLAWRDAKETNIIDPGPFGDALDELLREVDDALIAARKAAGAETRGRALLNLASVKSVPAGCR